MEAAFPCPLEREVASALLLLSTTPPSLSSPNYKSLSGDNSESLTIGNSKSYASSSVTGDDGCSSARNRLHMSPPLAARYHELKLKVVRKSRSKKFTISDCEKMSSGKSATVSWGSETSEVSSCLSSNGTSSNSCARSCNSRTDLGGDLKKKPIGSAHLRRRAEAIKEVLSHGGCISEVRIRELLGDSPDTSKALRMLLKQEVVKRSGSGGRTDPYIYMIA